MSVKVPSSGGHPLLRKHGLKVQWPKSQNHAKCPIHHGMNGKNVKNPGRDQSTKRCIILPLPQLELEHLIFEKCSFNQPPMSHPLPLWCLDKSSPGSKSTYSEMNCWLQQNQSNIDHFWKKDMALVKALRQYHIASNVLKGRTQWKFQKSWILHQVLDVIAMNMESMKRCLDFCDLTPVDQGFRHQDPNLHWLKAVAIKEVTHLTMILVLDEDHTHYSDAFRNIFKGGAFCKKCFPDGLSGIKMRKGGAAWPLSVISAHMHAQMMTTPIVTWQPSTSISSGAAGRVLGMSVDTCQRSGNTFSPTSKRALGSDPTHPTGRTRAANQNHPQMASQAMRRVKISLDATDPD